MAAPRFRVFLADSSDEERLNKLYSEKSTDGTIQINLDRSPHFFDALNVEGYLNGVYAVEDTQSGQIAGAGIRNLRKCYINGEVKDIGYLSGLRVAESYRRTRAMAMIFMKLRQLYLENECAGYICSVFNSNKTAYDVLTSGKAGMPLFSLIGELNTCIFKPVLLKLSGKNDFTIKNVQETDLVALVDFLQSEGSKFQYFPYYTKEDFQNTNGILKNLKFNNICIALKGNKIVGCLGLWDQTPFRRWKAEGYSGMLSLTRPLLNGLLRFSSYPHLPEQHVAINYRFLSLICIRENNSNIFAALYNQAANAIKKKENVLISCSFFDNDPLIKSLPKFKMSFKSSIFIGRWDETRSETDKIDNRFPYIEAGSL